MARWWRRGQPYRHAYRCGYCGWYPPGMGGVVRGRHDPRFVGHHRFCPSSLYAAITTAEGIADQWALIGAWARLADRVDTPGWDELWRLMSWSLMQRADQLGAEFPVCDDPRELMAAVA
jgi:hypothetical protein